MLTQENLDIRLVAGSIIETLDSLESYLTSAMNPNRVALHDLGMGTMGWTNLAYSPKAFEIWQKQRKLEPDDHLTLHHMAIMHHARAFDLEAGKNASAADEDWKTALALWHGLHGCAAFWDGLAVKACSGATNRQGVEDLRAVFPQLILGIHYDIALDNETRTQRKSRAKFHISLAQNSPFDSQSRSASRAAAYAKFIKAVPDHVWLRDELREEEVAKGTSIIEEYLLFDPGCPPALEDALRLQRRMQRARNIKWRAMSDEDKERTRILAAEKKDYEHWHPYFKQLVEVCEQLGEEVRANVASWYYSSGDSLCAYDKEEEAVKCFETAVLTCADEDDRKQYVRRLAQTLAYVAREKAVHKDSGARDFCDKVLRREDLNVAACLLLAQAYLSMFQNVKDDDFKLLETADRICQRGLEIEPDFDDLRADQYKEELKSIKENVRKSRAAAKIRTFLKPAQKAMEAERFEEALNSLNEAEKLAKSENVLRNNTSIYWLRAQAYVALRRIADAKKDAETLSALVAKNPSAEDAAAVKRLKEMVAQAEIMGDIKPLLEKARVAMKEERFASALTPLNEAAKKAPKNDVIYFLRCQAHVALGNFTEARRDAKTVAELAESDQDRQAVRRLNEMIAHGEKSLEESGGSEASTLRQEAVSAFNGDEHDKAIRLLRQAIEASKKCGHREGAPKLKAELSQILAMTAVSRANTIQESVGTNISMSSVARLRSSMNEVKQMLEEALTLDRTNSKAAENLAQVRRILTQLP